MEESSSSQTDHSQAPCFEVERLGIPTSKPELVVVLKWMETYNGDDLCAPDLRYLQFRKRRKILMERTVNEAMANYEHGLVNRLAQFKACLRNEKWDLLAVAPSCYDAEARMTHSEVFGAAARELRSDRPEAAFLKDCDASRKTDAGVESSTVDSVYAGMKIVEHPDVSRCNSALLVDDVFANGKTTAAMIRHLHQIGLSEQAQITIAVPLRVIPSKPKSKVDLWKFINQSQHSNL